MWIVLRVLIHLAGLKVAHQDQQDCDGGEECCCDPEEARQVIHGAPLTALGLGKPLTAGMEVPASRASGVIDCAFSVRRKGSSVGMLLSALMSEDVGLGDS
jgi:hypothetical protein